MVGEPFDGSGPIFATVSQANYVPISPSTDGGGSTDSSSVQQQDILVTRTKALDLLSPYAKGGKIATSGVADAGQTSVIMELIHNNAWDTAEATPCSPASSRTETSTTR